MEKVVPIRPSCRNARAVALTLITTLLAVISWSAYEPANSGSSRGATKAEAAAPDGASKGADAVGDDLASAGPLLRGFHPPRPPVLDKVRLTLSDPVSGLWGDAILPENSGDLPIGVAVRRYPDRAVSLIHRQLGPRAPTGPPAA